MCYQKWSSDATATVVDYRQMNRQTGRQTDKRYTVTSSTTLVDHCAHQTYTHTKDIDHFCFYWNRFQCILKDENFKISNDRSGSPMVQYTDRPTGSWTDGGNWKQADADINNSTQNLNETFWSNVAQWGILKEVTKSQLSKPMYVLCISST